MQREKETDVRRNERNDEARFAAPRRDSSDRRDSSSDQSGTWERKLDGPLARMLGVERERWE
jgi:hypothetical protein